VFHHDLLRALDMNLSQLLSRTELVKLIRFGVVGLSASLLYAILVGGLLRQHVGLLLAHCIAYATAIPYSYLAQRGFTFRSSSVHLTSLPRFLLTNGASFLLSTAIVAISRELQLPAAVAVSAVVVVAPLINCFCLNAWVFADRTSALP
jgi:putative flippase GtrA